MTTAQRTKGKRRKKLNAEPVPARMYAFGAKEPLDAELVAYITGTIMRRRFEYRNKIVAAELQKRDLNKRTIHRRFPELDDLEAEYHRCAEIVDDLELCVKRGNSEQRRRNSPLRQELKDARAASTAANARYKAYKAAAWGDPQIASRLDWIKRAHKERLILLRANSGLYWGNYLDIENSCDQIHKGPPPKLREHWDGSGRVAVQMQDGITPLQAYFANGTILRMGAPGTDPCPAEDKRVMVQLRIGSTPKKRPIFVSVPVCLDRPLPPDSLIKWAFLSRKRVGTRFEWQLLLSVTRQGGFAKGDEADQGALGLDLGWRLLDNGDLRISRFTGSNNLAGLREHLQPILRDAVQLYQTDDIVKGELRIPAHELQRWFYVRELFSTRETHFTAIKARLADWLAAHAAIVPDWLRDALVDLVDWKSAARLAGVILRWRGFQRRRVPGSYRRQQSTHPWPAYRGVKDGHWDRVQIAGQRFDGDAEILAELEEWRKFDKRLYLRARHTETKAIAWRTNLYRNFAAWVRRHFKTAVLEDIKWNKLQENPLPEDPGNRQAKYYQRIASVGMLATFIKETVRAYDLQPPAYTTQRCCICREIEYFEAKSELIHVCSHCGNSWDQDDNASVWLLGLHLRTLPPLPDA